MEELNPTPIIKYNDNQMQNVRKSVGYDDLKKLKQDLEQFEDWIRKQNHFTIKEFDRGFLERFLIYNKGSVERAKQRLDKFCTFNNLMPEFLQSYDIKNEFRNLLASCNTCILPKPTPDNYRIIAITLNGIEDDQWTFIEYIRYFIVTCEYVMFNDYCCGYEIVSDPTNASLTVLKKLNPFVLRKAAELIIEALGQRIKKIHLITGSKFFETLLTIIKQGLSAKIAQRLMVHSSFESLYKEMPKEILPSDFGGDEKSMKELAEMNFKELCTDEHIKHVKYLEQAKTDEDLRQTCKFNEEYSGLPGSFKTLCVD